jgi:hypothetical protein
VFNFDLHKLDWLEYERNCMMDMNRYVLKENKDPMVKYHDRVFEYNYLYVLSDFYFQNCNSRFRLLLIQQIVTLGMIILVLVFIFYVFTFF